MGTPLIIYIYKMISQLLIICHNTNITVLKGSQLSDEIKN